MFVVNYAKCKALNRTTPPVHRIIMKFSEDCMLGSYGKPPLTTCEREMTTVEVVFMNARLFLMQREVLFSRGLLLCWCLQTWR